MAGRTGQRAWRIPLLCIVLAAAFAVGWYGARRFQSPAQREAAARPPAAGPIFDSVTKGTLSDAVSGTGTVTYTSVASLTPTILPSPAVVTARTSRPGRELSAGDVLAEINGRPIFVFPGAFDFYRDLTPGDVGPDVEQLQNGLRAAGYPISADEAGRYGRRTSNAVKALYHHAGYSPPDLSTSTGTNPTTTSTSVTATGNPTPQTMPVAQLVGVPLTELAVTRTLPSTVVTALAVGAHPASGEPIANLARGQIVVTVGFDGSAFVRIAKGMSGTVTISGRAHSSPATVTRLSAATNGGPSTVTLAPSAALQPVLAGRSAVAIVTIKVIAAAALLVPTRAIATDTNGTQRLLVRNSRARPEATEIASHPVIVRVLGSLAGVSAVQPVPADALRNGDLVRVG
jgi:hypothetical protein